MELPIEMPEIQKNASYKERIELICDLTRRIELLEDLMKAARERRVAREALAGFANASLGDVNVQVCN